VPLSWVLSASCLPKYLQAYPKIQFWLRHWSRCHLGFSINLSNVAKSNNTLVIYEPELFPALRIRSFNPISVNVFSTGSVIICGIREPNEVYAILSQLRELCHNNRL
jgi:TATA-box binding protein (TBP) (component of TFIID and TFIIIB)